MARLIPEPLLKRVSDRFRLLSEPVRLQILNLIHTHGELPVQEIAERIGQSQANVSKHLRLMLDEGMVSRRKEGLFAYYRIDDPSLAGLCLLVCGQLKEATPGAARAGEADLPAAS